MTSPTASAPLPSSLAPGAGRGDGRAFPKGFVWGAATASYQIEGSVDVDGRGRSIWDTFAHTPGRILGGANGDVACDHYQRWQEDVTLLDWLGVGAYRFSISWPRWQPEGRGPIESRGVAFYDRLVDCLLQHGIQPWATLYHWDLPQTLQDDGGWAERDVAHRFAEYAASVGERLGDRLYSISTLNEPWCAAFLGYASGTHAPGRQDDAEALRAAHHLMLGHGEAIAALRTQDHRAQLGIAVNNFPIVPLVDRPEDHDVARRIDGLLNRFFLDPLLRGSYPADVIADLSPISDFSHVRDGDLELISGRLDLLGENYYSTHLVTAAGTPEGVVEQARQAAQEPIARWDEAPDGWVPRSPFPLAENAVFVGKGLPTTSIGWEVEPDGLVTVLNRLVNDYDCPPLYITENGSAWTDTVIDGTVQDDERAAYLTGHLNACLDAIDDGVDLRGYFAWSLMDNFEWAYGYDQRFGVIHVDFETQRRTPKASAHLLRKIARGNALPD